MRQRTYFYVKSLSKTNFHDEKDAVNTSVTCAWFEPTCQYWCISGFNLTGWFFHYKSYFSISLCALQILNGCQAFWILFYWVQSVFVLLSVHVLELCFEAQLSDLELVEADWPPPGAVLPESSTWCPELGLFSTQAGGDTPRSQRALGETSHHQVAVSAALGWACAHPPGTTAWKPHMWVRHSRTCLYLSLSGIAVLHGPRSTVWKMLFHIFCLLFVIISYGRVNVVHLGWKQKAS